eukprot:scaffold24458_cov93-Attheya_sp.AAC.2
MVESRMVLLVLEYMLFVYSSAILLIAVTIVFLHVAILQHWEIQGNQGRNSQRFKRPHNTLYYYEILEVIMDPISQK